MQPALSYDELISGISYRFQSSDGEPANQVRMVGIVFARPNSPLAKAEIIPQLNDWHFRSGQHIDFFFAGYTYPHPIVSGYVPVAIPGREDWLYSSELFYKFQKQIERKSKIQYSGACDLLLTNARFDQTLDRAVLDFRSTIMCQLDSMKAEKAIPSVEQFFESIFRFAEASGGSDPTWGFSDAQGLRIAGSALKQAVLSLLPKSVGEEAAKAKHFVVSSSGASA